MKKSTVALGIIVALSVVGVGGAWFTGEKAQTEYLRQIELANQKFQSLGLSDSVNLVYKNKQFDRSFFTSQVEDEVVISLPKEGQVFTIPFSTKLYHGPFPLNQLEKFNFVPTMFSAQGVIGKNETTQPLVNFPNSFPSNTNESTVLSLFKFTKSPLSEISDVAFKPFSIREVVFPA